MLPRILSVSPRRAAVGALAVAMLSECRHETIEGRSRAGDRGFVRFGHADYLP